MSSAETLRPLTLKILGQVGTPRVKLLFHKAKLPINGMRDVLTRFAQRTYWTEQELIFLNENLGGEILGGDLRVPSAVDCNRAMGRTFRHLHWRMEFERNPMLRGLGLERIIAQ